jgi:hypothetical protein
VGIAGEKNGRFGWANTIYRIGLLLAMVPIGSRYQTLYRWPVTNRYSGVMQMVAVKAIKAKSPSPDSVIRRSPRNIREANIRDDQTAGSIRVPFLDLWNRSPIIRVQMVVRATKLKHRHWSIPEIATAPKAIAEAKPLGVAKTGIRRQLSRG